MSPALSMKVPPVIWNPEADVKSGMEEQRRGDTSRAEKLYCSALLLPSSLRVPRLFLQHCALIWLHPSKYQWTAQVHLEFDIFDGFMPMSPARKNLTAHGFENLLYQFTDPI
jgi:hypothetical protein